MNAIVRSKVFRTAQGVAVHLPVSFGIGAGTELDLVDRGGEIVLTLVPPADSPEGRRERWDKMIDAMRALGPVGEIEVREPIEFPDRPGL